MADTIDQRVEETARTLLACVIEENLDTLERTLNDLVKDEDLFARVMSLVAQIATVVVIQRHDGRMPAQEDLGATVQDVVDGYSGVFPLERSDVASFVSRGLFGGEQLDKVLQPEKSVLVPLIVTGALLGAESDYDSWNDYLDVIEVAIENIGSDPSAEHDDGSD